MRVEVIVPKKMPLWDVSLLRRRVRAAMLAHAEEARVLFERTTATWNHSVGFDVQVTEEEARVGTDDDIYAAVNNGVGKRSIYPRSGPSLVFPTATSPRTQPGVIGSGGMYRGGRVARARMVHVGIRPRKFDEAIRRRMEAPFLRRMLTALRELF